MAAMLGSQPMKDVELVRYDRIFLFMCRIVGHAGGLIPAGSQPGYSGAVLIGAFLISSAILEGRGLKLS